MKISVWLLSLLLLSCGKKRASEETNPLVLDLPLLAERNLDSLAGLDYSSRLLAFAIDLGKRNLDLDKRIGHMLSAADAQSDWHDGVELVVKRDNYREAEERYLRYLGRYKILLQSPPREWDSSYVELWGSMERLSGSYHVIRTHDEYSRLPALLDTLLSNDLFINRALREFERRIKKDVLP